MKKKIGVIIGRFQINKPHEGHMAIFREVVRGNDEVLILIGSKQINRTINNPLTYEERKAILSNNFLTNKPLSFAKVVDMASDLDWSIQVDELIQARFTDSDITLYGSRKSFIPYYHGKYKTVELDRADAPAAIDLRRAVTSFFDHKSDQFIKGVIYGAKPHYPITYPVVDIAVIKGTDVLLGRRAHEQKGRFPGGFIDPSDSSIEQAVLRELREECGDFKVSTPIYQGSTQVEDYRYRGEADKIMTSFFICYHVDGSPKASEELVELKWVPLKEVTNNLVPEHIKLVNKFL